MINTVLKKRYRIVEEIGRGGMAIVYKAKDIKDNNVVAVKVLKHEYMKDKKFLERFKRESEASLYLNHCNIVKAYDVGQTIDLRYIVMEYVDGITLKEYIEQQRTIDVEKSLNIAMGIAAALRHAHIHGIVHRDIKPQNILIEKNGGVKVADFGIARAFASSTLTVGDTGVLGSVHYFSPEQARGLKVNEQSDIYSLGIVLYEMLTGVLPYEGNSAVEVALKHIESDINLTQISRKYIPKNVWDIILKATKRDKKDRYENAAAMYSQLKKAQKDPGEHFRQNLEFELGETKIVPKIGTKYHTGSQHLENNQPKQTTVTRKIMPIILAIVTIIVLISAFIIVSVVTNNFSFNRRPMENIIGLTVEEANEKLNDFNNQIHITENIHSDFKIGQIVEQFPLEGEEIKNDGVISIKVSKGPKQIKVANVLGMSKEEAIKKLEEAGFSTIDILEIASIEELGTVIKQNPHPFQEALPGDLIILNVSKGLSDNQAGVKDYISLGVEEAKDKIEADGFVVGKITEEYHDSIPSGKVYRQNPDVESVVGKGAIVDLWISLGPGENKERDIIITLQDELIIDPKNLKVIDENKEEIIIAAVNQKDNQLFITLKGVGSKIYHIWYENMEIESGDINFYE